MAKIWKEEDNQFLREHYMTMSNQELAEHFGVSKKAIQGKLRRLNLHRNEGEAENQHVVSEELKEKKKEEFVLKRKRLKVKINPPEKKKVKKLEYIKRETTAKRKRAIKEFNNAVNILASGDKEKAKKEFEFIVKTFQSEMDIMQSCKIYLKRCSSAQSANMPKPETAEDYYLLGIAYYRDMDIENARKYFKKASELDTEYLDPVYNLACLECKAGNVDAAMDALEILFKKDERLVQSAINDEDFSALLEDPRFIEMVKPYL